MYDVQITKRSEPISEVKNDTACQLPQLREMNNCTIFLGYTSNMISCGVREVIRFLAQHNMVGRSGLLLLEYIINIIIYIC